MNGIESISEMENTRADDMTRSLLLFRESSPCWDEETFLLAGKAPHLLHELTAKGLLRKAGGGYVLTPEGDMERLRCADRLRLTAFAAETPFDPKEALWNNRLRLLMGRAVLGRPGFNGYSLDEKFPGLPGLSRGGLWRYDDDGRVSYRWPSHPLVKSFLARFPLCGASARGSAAPGDAAMWRWAEAAGAKFCIQSFNMVLRSRRCHETPHLPEDIFYMNNADRLFFLRTAGKSHEEIYDAIGRLHLFLLGQRHVYLPGYMDSGSCGQENRTMLVLTADSEEELASLRKRCLSDGENLVEPAGPLFIAGTSVERLRKQEMPEDTVYDWFCERSVDLVRCRASDKARACKRELRRGRTRRETGFRGGEFVGLPAYPSQGPYVSLP